MRKLLTAGALTLLLVCLSASTAQAHSGTGVHSYCGKLVQPRSYCTGFDGITWGYNLAQFNVVGYGGSNPIEVCAIVDVYRRSPQTFVTRYKNCGFTKRGCTCVYNQKSAPYFPGYNGLTYMDFAYVYNRSPYAHTLDGGTIGWAHY